MATNISSPSSTSLNDPEKDATAKDAAPVNDAHTSNEKTPAETDDKHDDSDVEQGEPEKPKGPPPGAFDPRQNPDGGTKAWLCVLGGFCTLFCSFGWINCIGVFQNYYQTHQLKEYSPSTIAWVSSSLSRLRKSATD